MKLNKIKFERTIADKWKNGCPMCGTRQWSYDESLLVTPMNIEENGGIMLGGKILPLVAVSCVNCGNTVFINAKVVAVLDGLEQLEENNADKQQ